MNLLFASTCIPWPKDRGDRQRVYHLLNALLIRHRVTLVAYVNRDDSNPTEFPLRELCTRVVEVDVRTRDPGSAQRYNIWAPIAQRLKSLVTSPLPNIIRVVHSEEYVRVLRQLRCSEDFDLVWAVRSYIAEMVHAAGFRRVIVDVDDLESVKFAQSLRLTPWYLSKPIHFAELMKLLTYERLLPRRFTRLCVCKKDDRRFFGRNADKVFVVPNGVEDHAASDAASEQRGTLLFVARLDYPPNTDAACFLAEEILPILRGLFPEVRLMIVGGNPPSKIRALDNGGDCVVRANVPDLQPYYDIASVVVAPIRWGGGTRLKILEALGRGKAVVATTRAAEGIEIRPGIDLEIADSPQEFARTCARLLKDPEARRLLGASGRARVLNTYRWASVGETVNQLVSIVGSHRGSKSQ